MSLRHTLKTLIAGPQTQAASENYNYSQPQPPPQQHSQPPPPTQQFNQGPPSGAYGYHPPPGSYGTPQPPFQQQQQQPLYQSGYPQQPHPQQYPSYPAPLAQQHAPPPQYHHQQQQQQQLPLQHHQTFPVNQPPTVHQNPGYHLNQTNSFPQYAPPPGHHAIQTPAPLPVFQPNPQHLPSSAPPFSPPISATGTPAFSPPLHAQSFPQFAAPPVPSATHPSNNSNPQQTASNYGQPTPVTPSAPQFAPQGPAPQQYGHQFASPTTTTASTSQSTSAPASVSPPFKPHQRPPSPQPQVHSYPQPPVSPIQQDHYQPPPSTSNSLPQRQQSLYQHERPFTPVPPTPATPLPFPQRLAMIQHPGSTPTPPPVHSIQPPSFVNEAQNSMNSSASNGRPTTPKSQNQQHGFGAPPSSSPQTSPPTVKIHPSMLVGNGTWVSPTSISTGQIPALPSHHPQSPPPTSPPPDILQAGKPPAIRDIKGNSELSRTSTFHTNKKGSPSWTNLINIDGMPSATFTRLMDGIYNYAGASPDPEGLTPDQLSNLLERMSFPEDENHGKRLANTAKSTNHPDPTSFVNTNMIQFYTIFNYSYFIEGPQLLPLLTREGFTQYMISDILIDPSAMHSRYNHFMANCGNLIIDPSTKKAFGMVNIERRAFPTVPNDSYVNRNKLQLEALKARESADHSQMRIKEQDASAAASYSWGI